MTETNIENLDSQNEEINVADIENIDDVAVLKEKLKTIVPKYNETLDSNRQLFERTKKAEGFEKKDGKWVKIEKPEPPLEDKPPKKLPKKSDELDYGQLAFHNSKSNSLKIESDDEIAFVKQLIEETGKPLESLLNTRFFQTEYKTFKDSKTVNDSVPENNGRTNQISTSKSVAYWMNKGDELPPDIPENKQLIIDIVNARYKREKGE